ncbi:MAG: glutamine synthetase, partial [Clostridiales bacterium]|nr:glutamine synthetase [Clostridiales bacterium]
SKTPEITLFLNPIANSYERFGKFDAPKYVSWSHQNHAQLIRFPAATCDRLRVELRSPDPSTNPYLAFALIIAAGLDGVENGLQLPPSVDVDLRKAGTGVTETLEQLPGSLNQAIDVAEGSSFVRNTIGEELLAKFLAVKKVEAADFAAAVDKAVFYRQRFFDVI